jgi:diacylglycerol kinase family enzyme
MRVTVLINCRAGAGDAGSRDPVPRSIAAALGEAGVDADIRCVRGEALAEEARAAVDGGAEAVIAAGGDGTVSAVASALAGGAAPLGVLPVGTLNHFAKDLGLPLQLADAARTIAGGRVARIDLGRVGDRVFVNNSSLGVYARALVDREARRDLHGLSKWPAMALAVLKVFKRRPLTDVWIEVDGRPLYRKTPLVFIGNNRYELDLLRIGRRACLDEGLLSLYIANTATRWGMLKLAVRAAFGRLEQSRDFESMCAERIRIDVSARRARHLALDGEIAGLEPPLEYRIDPAALPVIVPAGYSRLAREAGDSLQGNAGSSPELTSVAVESMKAPGGAT